MIEESVDDQQARLMHAGDGQSRLPGDELGRRAERHVRPWRQGEPVKYGGDQQKAGVRRLA